MCSYARVEHFIYLDTNLNTLNDQEDYRGAKNTFTRWKQMLPYVKELFGYKIVSERNKNVNL